VSILVQVYIVIDRINERGEAYVAVFKPAVQQVGIVKYSFSQIGFIEIAIVNFAAVKNNTLQIHFRKYAQSDLTVFAVKAECESVAVRKIQSQHFAVIERNIYKPGFGQIDIRQIAVLKAAVSEG